MITGILFIILVGLLVHYAALQYGRRGRRINKIPGPRMAPLIGNLLDFQTSPAEIWKHMRHLADEYYPIYRLWFGTTPTVNLRHPDDIEIILGSPKYIHKSNMYDPVVPWLNTGLLTSSGTKWHQRRKILTPAFHFNILQQFVHVFVEESNYLIDSLKNEGGPSVQELVPFYSKHTLSIVCKTAMGTSLRDKGSFQPKYRKAVHDMGQLVIYRITRPWFQSEFLFNLVPQGWHQAKVLQILHKFTTEVIEERKNYHNQTNNRYLSNFKEDSNQTDDDIDEKIGKRRLTMLDLLIETHRKNQIDDEGIREEVDTFMFTGHDTTATALTYITMLLAEHKEVQDRARAEINKVLNEIDGKVTMSTLQNLPYLDRCIKESLRLYPSAPSISRHLETDVQLKNYTLPAGAVVIVHIIDVHRDPNFWPNPEVFDPDRFLPENVEGRHPYAYVPFSAGPRNCIGQRFAMLKVKATLLFLLHNFYLEPIDHLKNVSIDINLTLQPTRSPKVKFVPIQTTE
ncbi:cytochrome P450 4C1-like [Hylaeus volcanicus]|uniref:cytochrome P450 4C1-like n=1 Tax=Hylaeus volcanicus TaxID=313075 RepID=UPI0023B78A6F|nr:cytochrome P450 4C1-like [Hylaeus volcanicus]XP_053982183.1 cytochrome P450 4C1-like [Hylaeus volcanicus]